LTNIAAFGLGVATSARDKLLDAWYPLVDLGETPVAGMLAGLVGHKAGGATHALPDDAPTRLADHPAAARTVERLVEAAARPSRADASRRRRAVVSFVEDLGSAPVDACDVLLRLHLLSHRLIRPHGASLEGAFGLLNTVVWTDLGPWDPEGFEELRVGLAAEGREVRVTSVDKFPRMTDHVVPSGVRIGDADRVRLGAYLAPGTTVMHEGFVNFNAGTLGASMIEGRISAGVVIGDGSDLGGGASVMGTLSGGGSEVIRVGERSLVGANAGIGISLGDDCVVEAGLYVTAGTKVALPDGSVVPARRLSGHDGLLLRRDSRTGAVVALARSIADWGGLNPELHANE